MGDPWQASKLTSSSRDSNSNSRAVVVSYMDNNEKKLKSFIARMNLQSMNL